jgi:hypothetical protein
VWKEEVRQVAISWYHLVLEDGRDLSGSSDDVNLPVDELQISQGINKSIKFDVYSPVGVVPYFRGIDRPERPRGRYPTGTTPRISQAERRAEINGREGNPVMI